MLRKSTALFLFLEYPYGVIGMLTLPHQTVYKLVNDAHVDLTLFVTSSSTTLFSLGTLPVLWPEETLIAPVSVIDEL